MDFEDDLLALAGDGDAPQPAAASAEVQGKRKRATADESGSDMDESSSSDGEAAPPPTQDFVSPFPYHILFHDRADEKRIMALNEVERESILAERQDEVQKQKDRIQVRKMASGLSGQAAAGDSDADLAAGGSNLRGKSERKKTTTGKSDKKSDKLDELKRKREHKKRREAERDVSDDASAGRGGGGGRGGLAFSDEDSESEEEQEVSTAKKGGRRKQLTDHQVADELSLRGLYLQRTQCSDNWHKPWFAEAVKGCCVRIVVGPDPENPGENKYRLGLIHSVVEPFTRAELSQRESSADGLAQDAAQADQTSDMDASDDENGKSKDKKRQKSSAAVQTVQADLAKEKKRRAFQPYKLDSGVLCDLMLDVRHGKAAKLAPITELSNQPFTRREFQRLKATLEVENGSLPLMSDVESKAKEIKACLDLPKSEADIDAALRKKKLLHDPRHVLFIKTQCRDATSDEARRQRYDAEIRDLTSRLPAAASIASPAKPSTSAAAVALNPRSLAESSRVTSSNSLAQLSERNRRANREEVRKAELALQEARRKAEKDGKVDPSARVRTAVRVLHDVRAGTPDASKTMTFEAPTAAMDESTAKMKAVMAESMVRSKAGPTKLEERAQNIDIDLGDF